MGGFDYIADADLLTYAYGNGVDALCECALQRNGVSCEISVGVRWCPYHFLLFDLIVHLHADELISTFVTWRETLVHGFGVHKKLECGTRLAHARHFVVFP